MTQTTPAKKNWSDEAVAQLIQLTNGANPVSADDQNRIAETMGLSVRSVSAKLRNLEIGTASLAKETVPTFSVEESSGLAAYVMSNAGLQTYAEIAAGFEAGKFSAKASSR